MITFLISIHGMKVNQTDQAGAVDFAYFWVLLTSITSYYEGK
jgi:hypothetical protein